jgi:hypothetical protein
MPQVELETSAGVMAVGIGSRAHMEEASVAKVCAAPRCKRIVSKSELILIVGDVGKRFHIHCCVGLIFYTEGLVQDNFDAWPPCTRVSTDQSENQRHTMR